MREGTISSLTPTVSRLFRVGAPALSSESPLDSVVGAGGRTLDSGTGGSAPARARIDRCLIYCPDALGDNVLARWPELAARLGRICPHRVRLSSMLPPKTPVCYASVFTGAPPERHGIRRYERPVLECDTLFDVLLRAGRRVAIIAVRDCSIDRIFRGRAIDYFSEQYDREVVERTLSIIDQDRHDLVVAYVQEYDDRLHETQPFSDECAQAARHHVEAAETVVTAARKAWSSREMAAVIAPDHGGHLDADTGRGDHGLDIPEDMEVSHWYGVFTAGRPTV